MRRGAFPDNQFPYKVEVLDVIRMLGEGTRNPHAEGKKETAADLMVPTSLTIPANTTIHDALAQLAQKHLSLAAITDGSDQPIGIVSRHALRREGRNSRRPVGEVMVPVFFCVRSKAPAGRVMEEIRSLGLDILFVIADDKGLGGVICDAAFLSETGPRETQRVRSTTP
jgi:CBS domain-containing protein